MSSSTRARATDAIETAVLLHLGVLALVATWGYGGNDSGVRRVLSLWGSLAPLLVLAAPAVRGGERRVDWRRLWWLAPPAAFNLLVLAACLTPGLREVKVGAQDYFTVVPQPAWKPSSAMPHWALPALWLFDATYLSCFNVALLVRRRATLRRLLTFVCGNAVVLAVFGTVQKLAGASGPFFGFLSVRQPYFFASFIYHNHWGAFTVLMVATCLGLTWYHALRPNRRNFLHSPAMAGLVALLFLAATAPLSGSRSCTVLQALILAGAFGHWCVRLRRSRREHGESAALPLGASALAAALALGAVVYLAQDMIGVRLALTRKQVAEFHDKGAGVGRGILYRDTLRMARDRPWFGWGMASYPKVFAFYNSQWINPADHLQVQYFDAHNDWFQAAAEHGLVGSLMLALCALVPLAACPPRGRSPLPPYLLAGCGLVLLYAWLEFPFGNTCVVFVWWLLFFGALRYAELQRAAVAARKEHA